MLIRAAKPEDAPALIKLFHHLNEYYFDNPEAILTSIRQPGTSIFVAEQNGQIIGTATISLRGSPANGLIGHIDDVVIDPTYRGQGVAKKLMERCFEIARQNRCVFVDLTCSPERQAANRLYEKINFFKIETGYFVKVP